MTHPVNSEDCRSDAELLAEIVKPEERKPVAVTGNEFGVRPIPKPDENEWIADLTMRTDK